jgi:hypothetical protein
MILKTLFSPLPGNFTGSALKALATLPVFSFLMAFNADSSRRYAYLPVSNRTSFPYTIF